MTGKLFRVWAWGLSLGLLGAVGAAACGSEDGGTAASSTSGGASGGGGAAASGYGDSACGDCVKASCAAEIDACAGDPGCAQHLTCLYACPIDAAGDAGAVCAAACTVPDSSTAQAAQKAVADCRAFGRGATRCPACGVPNNTHPLLNQQCGPSSETNTCFKCEDEQCCETYAACKADPACDALSECLKACPDATYDACVAQCQADHPAGIGGFGARIGCLLALCAEDTACNDVPLSGCERCTNAECGDEFIACYADPECYLLAQCTTPCGADEACFQACREAHPSAEQRFNDFAICSTESCSAECG